MSLIPGYTRADDSVVGGVNTGITGNRAFMGAPAGVRSVTMNPYTAAEFGYGAVATTQGAGNGDGPIGNNAEPGNAADDAAVAASVAGCLGFDGNDANSLEGFV